MLSQLLPHWILTAGLQSKQGNYYYHPHFIGNVVKQKASWALKEDKIGFCSLLLNEFLNLFKLQFRHLPIGIITYEVMQRIRSDPNATRTEPVPDYY